MMNSAKGNDSSRDGAQAFHPILAQSSSSLTSSHVCVASDCCLAADVAEGNLGGIFRRHANIVDDEFIIDADECFVLRSDTSISCMLPPRVTRANPVVGSPMVVDEMEPGTYGDDPAPEDSNKNSWEGYFGEESLQFTRPEPDVNSVGAYDERLPRAAQQSIDYSAYFPNATPVSPDHEGSVQSTSVNICDGFVMARTRQPSDYVRAGSPLGATAENSDSRLRSKLLFLPSLSAPTGTIPATTIRVAASCEHTSAHVPFRTRQNGRERRQDDCVLSPSSCPSLGASRSSSSVLSGGTGSWRALAGPVECESDLDSSWTHSFDTSADQ